MSRKFNEKMNLKQFLFSYEGRIGRFDYWVYSFCFYVIVAVFSLVSGVAIVKWIVFLIGSVIFYTIIPVTIKRLHDTNRSGWNLLCVIAFPFGNLYLFIICVLFRGKPEPNKYGYPPIPLI